MIINHKLFVKRIDCFRPYLKGKKVLDLGCVGGDFRLGKPIISSLHKEIVNEAKETIGVDLDRRGIELMNIESPDLKFVCADVYSLPFTKDSFDVVVVGDLIEHLDNVGVFLNEVKRVLKTNGVLLGSVPNAYNFAGFLRLFFRSQPTPSRNSTHVHLFDNRTLYLLFLQNAFSAEIYFRNFPNPILKIVTFFYPMFSPAIIFVAKKISPIKVRRSLKGFYRSIVL